MNTNNVDTIRTEKKLSVWVLCVAAIVLVMYIAAFPLMPMADLLGVAALLVFTSVYSLIFARKSYLALCAPIAAAVGTVLGIAIVDGFTLSVCLRFANVLFAVVTAYCIHRCTKAKASRSKTFAVISGAGAVYVLTTLLFVVYDIYGSISFETVRTAVDSAADYFGKTYRVMLEYALEDKGGDSVEVRRMVKALAENMALSVKASIPSSIVIYGMAFSALSAAVYGKTVRVAGMMKECFDGRNWRFSMSKVSCVMFELIYLAYIVVMLFSDSLVLNSALMNIISVLTVPFAYIGIRHFYGILRRKVPGKVMSAVIIAAIIFLLMMLTGGTLIFTFIAFVGSSVEFKRNYTLR